MSFVFDDDWCVRVTPKTEQSFLGEYSCGSSETSFSMSVKGLNDGELVTLFRTGILCELVIFLAIHEIIGKYKSFIVVHSSAISTMNWSTSLAYKEGMCGNQNTVPS